MSRRETLVAVHEEPVSESRPIQTKNRWLKLRYVAVVGVCVWAMYHYVHVQKPQMAELAAKQSQLQHQLQSMNQQQDALSKQAQELQNNDYIARYASEHYNLILPGQVMFNVKH